MASRTIQPCGLGVGEEEREHFASPLSFRPDRLLLYIHTAYLGNSKCRNSMQSPYNSMLHVTAINITFGQLKGYNSTRHITKSTCK